MNRRTLGIAFCFGTIFACAVLHVASFLTILPVLSIVVPVVLLTGAISVQVDPGYGAILLRPEVVCSCRMDTPDLCGLAVCALYRGTGEQRTWKSFTGSTPICPKTRHPANLRSGI